MSQNLKKKILAATVAGVTALSTVTVAPSAQAFSFTSTSTVTQKQQRGETSQILSYYKKFSREEEQKIRQEIQSTDVFAPGLMQSDIGFGWCVDLGLHAPQNSQVKNHSYEVRKLTGQSGAYGDGLGLHDDIRVAAVNVTKELLKAAEAGNNGRVQKLNLVLQALLGNNLGHLNGVREEFYYNKGGLTNREFEYLTGFKIDRRQQAKVRNLETNYYFVKTSRHNEIKSTVKSYEYITVLVPTSYNTKSAAVDFKAPQRLITIYQPGLEITPKPKPKPEPTPEVTPDPKPTPTPQQPTPTTETATETTTKTTTQTTTATTTVTHEPSTTTVVVPGEKETRIEKHYFYSYFWSFESWNNQSRKITVENNSNVKVIGEEWVEWRREGNTIIITPKPGSNGKTVKVIVTNPDGSQSEHVINIEYKTQITTGGSIEIVSNQQAEITIESGDSYRVIGGDSLIRVVERNGKLIIVGVEGASGTDTIVVTDKYGNEIHYKITVTTPSIKNNTFTLENGSSSRITIENSNWEYRVVQGQDLIDVSRNGNQLIITGKEGANGAAIVEVVDAHGNVIYRYSINVVWNQQDADAPEFSYRVSNLGNLKVNTESGHKLTITENGHLVELTQNGNQWIIVPKQDAEGVVVVEERDGQDRLVATHKITIFKAQVQTSYLEIYNTQEINGLPGKDLTIVSGSEHADLNKNGSTWTLTPKKGAEGTVVIEDRDEHGRVIGKIQVTIKAQPVVVQELNKDIFNNVEHKLTFSEGWSFNIVENQADVTVERQGDKLVVKPKPGKTGRVYIELKNEHGQLVGKVTLNVKNPPAGNRTRVIENYSVIVINVRGNNKLVVREGGDLVVIDGNKVTPTGKPGTVIIEERDANGNVVNVHTIEIKPGKTTTETNTKTVVEIEITEGNTLTPKPGKGGDLVIIDGNEVKPKGKPGTVIIEERDGNGNVVNTHEIVITDNNPAPKPGTGETGEKDGKNPNQNDSGNTKIEITDSNIKRNQDGSITVTVPGGNKGNGKIEITDGNADDYNIVQNPDGTWTITRKDGKPVDGVSMIWVSNNTTNRNTNININGLSSREDGEGGSSKLDDKCIWSIVGLTAPLALLIPLGILSQVSIPGLEPVHQQLNMAVQRANTSLQRGLGIYDEDKAGRAAGVDAALRGIDASQLALAGGALAAVAVGLAILDGVLRACGKEEATSSYAIQQAVGKAKDKKAEKEAKREEN